LNGMNESERTVDEMACNTKCNNWSFNV